ncbi:MAG TPA: hypothetical protein VIH03_05165, partial [Nitrososphaerales archaeon]
NSIALTVTSPPYHNAINYSKHLQKGWYIGNQVTELDEYLNEMQQIFNEVFRVTRQGGYPRCCTGTRALAKIIRNSRNRPCKR